MIPNKLKRLWAEGKPTLNGWCSIGNAFTAEIMAAQGYDSVTVDVQHGALDYSSLLPMLQAMRASGVVPMARVPWLRAGHHHEGARRRRLRHHLPDGEQRRGRRRSS